MPDRLNDVGFIYFAIWKSQHFVPALLQPLRAAIIVGNCLIQTVLVAIQFDNKFRGGTKEIHHVWPKGRLAAESHLSHLLFSKLSPKPPLGFS
jgi:hypothetical protein